MFCCITCLCLFPYPRKRGKGIEHSDFSHCSLTWPQTLQLKVNIHSSNSWPDKQTKRFASIRPRFQPLSCKKIMVVPETSDLKLNYPPKLLSEHILDNKQVMDVQNHASVYNLKFYGSFLLSLRQWFIDFHVSSCFLWQLHIANY